MPYTQNFARKSGVQSPKKIANQLIWPCILRGRCASTAYTSNWCAAQLMRLRAPVRGSTHGPPALRANRPPADEVPECRQAPDPREQPYGPGDPVQQLFVVDRQ